MTTAIKKSRRERTTEKELIAPAVITLLKLADKNGNVSSAEFRSNLLKMVYSRLTKKDKEKLPSRNIMRVEQTIMNLVSHRTLDRKGLAAFNVRHGTFKIRAKARDMAISSLSKSYQ